MRYWLTGAKLGLITWFILLIITVLLRTNLFIGTLVLGWILPLIGWMTD